MADDLEMLRKRALYRAGHRGTKEMDLLLGRFAAARLPEMNAEALSEFEKLLEVADQSLQGWILEAQSPVDESFAGLISAIRAFHGLTDRAP